MQFENEAALFGSINQASLNRLCHRNSDDPGDGEQRIEQEDPGHRGLSFHEKQGAIEETEQASYEPRQKKDGFNLFPV